MSTCADIEAELRATWTVAAPLAAANLAQMAMGFTDTVMLGRLGGAPLAAAGLGAGIYFTGGIVLQGTISATAPLAAHAFGAGDRDTAGRIAGAGLALAALLALPLVAAVISFDALLRALGYDPALAAEIGRFLRSIAWGAPAFLGFAALRSLLAALSRTTPVMVLLVLCIAANAGFDWALIFGHLGAPVLGAAGAGYATAIVQWLMLLGLTAYIRWTPALAATHVFRGVLVRHRDDLRRILRLGLPISGIIALEIGVFGTVGILMGLLGTNALAAHQLVLNCASFTFMVPLGVSQAATVRVAAELGAGRPEVARRAGGMALALGVLFMAATAVVLWTAPGPIIGVYVDRDDPANEGIVAIARHLLVIAALFQVFDGVQVIAAGALRGYKDTTVPMLLAALGYWAIGFAGGWVLAFPLGYGPVGLWWGLAIGLAAVGALLSLRLFRTAAPRARMEAPATSSPLPFPPPQPGEGQGERIGGSGG